MDFKVVDLPIVAKRRRRSKWRDLAVAVSQLPEYVPGQTCKAIELACPDDLDVDSFANNIRCAFNHNESVPRVKVTENRDLGVVYVSRAPRARAGA